MPVHNFIHNFTVAPTLTSVVVLTSSGQSGNPLGNEDTAIMVPYSTLLAAADENDIDGDFSRFRITAVTAGILEIQVGGGTNAWATVSAATDFSSVVPVHDFDSVPVHDFVMSTTSSQ